MSNPRHILATLDKHLTLPAELNLFGRSALALGFTQAPAAFHSTQDVDGILPLAWLEGENTREDFWEAVQKTNAELEPGGLYITHLFREVDVILQPDWLTRRVQLPLNLRRLTVFRPATIDLVLTKMARGDEDDLEDIRFLLQQEKLTSVQLQTAFSLARLPDVPEIHALFEQAQPKVLAFAIGAAGERSPGH